MVGGLINTQLTHLDTAGAGFAIEPESAKDLADRVLTLYRDPALRERLGQAGRAFVEAHFDRRVLAGRYLGLLDGVAAGR